MSRVSVIGLGHVGLPSAALLAAAGHEVIGCDTAPEVVARIEAGREGFPEPGLDALVAEGRRAGRLRARPKPAPAEFHLIAVPTPLAPGQRADLSHVRAAAAAIAPVLRPGDTVILESTVPVGTTERLAGWLGSARPDLALPRPGRPAPPGGVRVAHCPERVLPGRALHELVHNDRVVGGVGPDCAARAAALYRGFVQGGIELTACRMAELVKLAENAFRDVNIAFANELAAICGRLGLDPWQAIALANRHPRVQVLSPGAGVGGQCVAVDPWFLTETAPEESRLIRAARAVNDATPRRIAARIRAAAARFGEPRIACLGLAYKPEAGDLRESPALSIVAELAEAGFRVTACDPFVAALPPHLAALPHLSLAREPLAALAQADIVAVLVSHAAFRRLDPALFAGRVVVDAVGLLPGSAAPGPAVETPEAAQERNGLEKPEHASISLSEPGRARDGAAGCVAHARGKAAAAFKD